MKLYELMDLWLENEVRHTKARKTYLCYSACSKQIRNFDTCFKNIKDVSNIEIQQLLFSLNGYSKSTIHNTRIVINSCFKYAVINKLIDTNNIGNLKIPKNASVKVVEALTKRQQDRIEEIAENDMLGHIVIFLLRTGLRVEEMSNLKWVDFNNKCNTIKVTKSKTPTGIRELPLSKGARFIIEYCRKNNKSEYIFLNSKGDKISYSSIQKLFARLKKESGILWFTPHVCRHSFATRMVERGVSIKALSELLGHKDVAFTLKRYATADIDFLRKQISLIDD